MAWKPPTIFDDVAGLGGEAGKISENLWRWGNRQTRWVIFAILLPILLIPFFIGGAGRAFSVLGIGILCVATTKGGMRLFSLFCTTIIVVLMAISSGLISKANEIIQTKGVQGSFRELGKWLADGGAVGSTALPLGTLVSFVTLILLIPPLIWIIPLFFKKGRVAMRVPASIIGGVLTLVGVFSAFLFIDQGITKVDWSVIPVFLVALFAIFFLGIGIQGSVAKKVQKLLGLIILLSLSLFALGGISGVKSLKDKIMSSKVSHPSPPKNVEIEHKPWPSGLSIRKVRLNEPVDFDVRLNEPTTAFDLPAYSSPVIEMPGDDFYIHWSTGEYHRAKKDSKERYFNLLSIFPNGNLPSAIMRFICVNGQGKGTITAITPTR